MLGSPGKEYSRGFQNLIFVPVLNQRLYCILQCILFFYSHYIFLISYAFASVPVRADHTESSFVMCSACLRKA